MIKKKKSLFSIFKNIEVQMFQNTCINQNVLELSHWYIYDIMVRKLIQSLTSISISVPSKPRSDGPVSPFLRVFF